MYQLLITVRTYHYEETGYGRYRKGRLLGQSSVTASFETLEAAETAVSALKDDDHTAVTRLYNVTEQGKDDRI